MSGATLGLVHEPVRGGVAAMRPRLIISMRPRSINSTSHKQFAENATGAPGDAWRTVHVFGVDENVVEFEESLQVELVRVGLCEQNERSDASLYRAVECLGLRHSFSPT